MGIAAGIIDQVVGALTKWTPELYFDGVLLTGDYKLTDHSKNIVANQKHSWCKLGECHELEILNEDYILISLAVSSAISIYYGIYDENNTVPI